MKRTKEEPSVAGLLLLVTGMLLLSVVALNFLGNGPSNGSSMLLMGVGAAAVLCMGAGAVLSSRKKKQPK